jgi:hypothetical protein
MGKPYEKEDKTYDNVPGHGKYLEDGTWWVNIDRPVGHVCITQYYDRQIIGGQWWASDRQARVVGTATFDGKRFSRWEVLEPTPLRPCICYNNNSLEYKD